MVGNSARSMSSGVVVCLVSCVRGSSDVIAVREEVAVPDVYIMRVILCDTTSRASKPYAVDMFQPFLNGEAIHD